MSTSPNNLFEWKKLSRKQLDILTWWHKDNPLSKHDVIIADGSIRSGKTLSMSFSFVLWAMLNYNGQLFGIAGKTIGSARKNILKDLKIVLAGRGYHVVDKRADNLIEVSKGNIKNTFEIFGGKDESSQDLIQGRTLAGILLDEVALMPRSFIDQAIGRCSVDGSKIWMNCNPAGPFHFIKTDFIDDRERINALYIHFELDDNLSLSEKVKNRLKNFHKGLFYKRYILGLWVMAEGVIYDMFNEEKHIIDIDPNRKFRNYIIGCDYGASNPTAFPLIGYNNPEEIYVIKEYYYDPNDPNGEQRTKVNSEYAKDLIQFIGDTFVQYIYADPSAASFIAELEENHLPVKQAENDVHAGIFYVAKLLGQNKLFISRCCTMTIKEFETYSWDAKAQKRGEDKPIKENDHAMDALRYALFTHFGNAPQPIEYQSFGSVRPSVKSGYGSY